MIVKHKEIYKKDSNENTRVWWMESEDDKFRVHSGVLNGQIVVSGWTVCEPKNTGKKNSTTAKQQCLVEVEANYKKKLAQGNYKESPDAVTLNEDNFFKPMLAKEYGEDGTYVSGSTVYSQPKLDGCVSYDTLISCEDGDYKIGDIVLNRLAKKVKSMNMNKMGIEYKDILNFMSFEEDSEWFLIEFEDGTTIKATGNHEIWSETQKKWVRVDELGIEEVCLKQCQKP